MAQRQMTQDTAKREAPAMRCKQISPERVPSSEAISFRMLDHNEPPGSQNTFDEGPTNPSLDRLNAISHANLEGTMNTT